ncbi:sulfotransferase domain-containing protein [Gloeothece verrucosa]|uniref:Sulfotransferase n=1 Tax=Gloeothece verrucosa (strain PCC 7822) TaxID=497965 RepID=E0UFL4_GLOV7|nr:sulfotransferase domain-containing protein [Gloeothece verrucosa]ADN13125.1 sulfotransferase [Gloeothece verrucosa PCC 7822]
MKLTNLEFLYKLNSRLAQKFFIDLAGDTKNTIFISSSPRSGSTWLAEIIEYITKSRFIFEPFHTGQVNFGLPNTRPLYLRPQSEYPQYKEAIEKIVNGKIKSQWTDTLNKQILPKKRLIKAIHSNLMLKWLMVNYPDIKFIYLLRNPFSVSLSIARMGGDIHLEDMLSQETLVKDFLADKIDIINSANTAFEKAMVRWTIEQFVPLSLFENDDNILIIFYENLCLNTEKEISKISKFLQEDIDNTDVSSLKKMIKKPSATAFLAINKSLKTEVNKAEYDLKSKNKLTEWQNSVEQSQIDYGLKLLQAFNLDKLYNDDLIPNTALINKW